MKRFTGFFDILKGAFRARFQPATLTANRNLTLADKSGTLAVMETMGATSANVRLNGITTYPTWTVTGAITFAVEAGAVAGSVAYVRLVANGTNIPAMGPFKRRADSRAYVNTSGTTNVFELTFDGTDYWYTVWAENTNTISASGVALREDINWTNLSGKPTTVAGFGITDAVDTLSTQTVNGIKTFNNASTFVCTGATSAALMNQSWTGNSLFGLQILGDSSTNSPAFLAFHRSGVPARYFGLDTDGTIAAVGGAGGGYSSFKCGTLISGGTASGNSYLQLSNESKTGATPKRTFIIFNTRTGDAGYPPIGGLHIFGYAEGNASIIHPFGILDTGEVVIPQNTLRIPPTAPPANNATGVAGDFRLATDGNVYICVGANSWRRVMTTTY